jgi:death-on-curing protein
MEFLPKEAIIAIHDRLLIRYGGSGGIRDTNLLDSAINHPKTKFHFCHSTVFEIAAEYAFHICQDHPFVDGNKRTARMTMIVFLRVNGIRIVASEDESLEKILSIAEGKMNKMDLAQWIECVSEKM